MNRLSEKDFLEKIGKAPSDHGALLWDMLTPFERDRLLKRIEKQNPEILQYPAEPKMEIKPQSINQQTPISTSIPKQTLETISESQESLDSFPYERSVWDIKTLYQVAFADMIEQRTTMMKFLLNNYGIEAVEKFFLHDNPQWAEKLKVGKVKKVFAKLISKLAPRMIMNKLSDIIIENAQYLVPLDHITLPEADDDKKFIKIENCPVLKRFKKTLKALNFNDLEERYICTFACVPVIAQMASVGNCNVSAEYQEKGCQLHVSLKAKSSENLEILSDSSLPIKNGPS